MPLEPRRPFQAGVFGEPTGITKAGKRPILIDAKDADGAGIYRHRRSLHTNGDRE